MNLNGKMVMKISSSKVIYKPGHPVEIEDEGSYYRIDGTFIYDKNKIKSIQVKKGIIVLQMVDEDVTLQVIEKT